MQTLTEPLTTDQRFKKLLPSFQAQVTRIQNDNWLNCFRLGVLLYQYAVAMWQVYGSRLRHERQYIHLDFASQVLALGVRKLKQDTHLDVTDYACALDTFDAWKAVVEASSMRLHPQLYSSSEAQKPFAKLAGIGGIHQRCSKRAVIHPEHQHAVSTTAALAFRLACGDVFGFLAPYNERDAAYFLKEGLDNFDLGEDSPDYEAAYRKLLLDAAMQALASGGTALPLFFCNKALKSAKTNGDVDDITRAKLIRRFGKLGNRLAYLLILRRNWAQLV